MLLAGLEAGQGVRSVRGEHLADLGQLQPVAGTGRKLLTGGPLEQMQMLAGGRLADADGPGSL